MSRAIDFPKHACGLYLEHNVHKDYYETAESYILDYEKRDLWGKDCWASPTARTVCMETNEIWSLRWYPDTPISFLLILGPTLEEILKAANKLDAEA